MSGKAEFRKNLQPYYEEIKEELEPLITRILKVSGTTSREYLQFKTNAREFYVRFVKAIKISGKVSSLQTLLVTTEEPQLQATLKLFHYLGLVESIGTTIIDMLVLLLIANGYIFHVERRHESPRITHATTFKDIDAPNSTLADKLSFLEQNGLRKSSQLVDRKLRNDIAHLEFDINNQGKVSTEHCKELNIDKKTNDFTARFMAFFAVLEDCSFIRFLNKTTKENDA